MICIVDFVDKRRKLAEKVYFPGTFWSFFAGVGIGGFEDRVHATPEGAIYVLVDAVSDEHYVLHHVSDFIRGDFEDSQVGLTKVKLVRVDSDGEKIEDPELLEVLFE